jgi:hypothetical protein
MTPKEKARELFDKYQIAGSQWYVDTTKKYVLITVDEILQSGKDVDEFADSYWLQVKQEIENL